MVLEAGGPRIVRVSVFEVHEDQFMCCFPLFKFDFC